MSYHFHRGIEDAHIYKCVNYVPDLREAFLTQPVFRFAPSPNGRLHLGHAYSALLNAGLARANCGRFLLRIEDIDRGRCRPELEEAVYEDLAWIGLEWFGSVRRQSEHLDEYRSAFGRLQKSGLVYPCFCSRRDIAQVAAERGLSARDPDGALLYPGTCRLLTDAERRERIARGDDHAWRLDMGKALSDILGELSFSTFMVEMATFRIGPAGTCICQPERWGDPILVRKETPTSYHLSVVLDDALQQVTHVVRGRDLEAATDLHVLLQKLFELPTPLYHHHALILGGAGEKLSKSLLSESLADLRTAGRSPKDIRTMLGFQ